MPSKTLREKCPNTELFLVRIFLYSVPIQENTDQKQLLIWTLFTQWNSSKLNNTISISLTKEMSGKSLKIFGLPTTKWPSFTIFAKLNENFTNIFKLHEYRKFGLMKMPKKQYLSYNIGKSGFTRNKFNVYKKVWFTITGHRKSYF